MDDDDFINENQVHINQTKTEKVFYEDTKKLIIIQEPFYLNLYIMMVYLFVMLQNN